MPRPLRTLRCSLCLGCLVGILLLNGCQESSSTTSSLQPPPAAVSTPPATAAPKSDIEHPGHSSPPTAPVAETPPSAVSRWTAPDIAQLEQRGIRHFVGRSVRIFSDLSPDEVSALPPYADQCWEYLQQTFGPLNADAPMLSQSPVIAYLMRDQQTFEGCGLIPPHVPAHHSGWHLDRVVWVQHQASPYYRRHLLFHELSHAYWNTRRVGPRPDWLEEGLAEVTATHRLESKGITFGVVPRSRDEFEEWGRLFLIRTDVQRGTVPTIDQMRQWRSKDYTQVRSYAWCWGLVYELLHHPQTGQTLLETLRTWPRESSGEAKLTAILNDRFVTEWGVQATDMDYGWDAIQTAVTIPQPSPPPLLKTSQVNVQADRGWQPTEVTCPAGRPVELKATGQVTLARTTRPWISEPDGISLRYERGWPIGMLLGRWLTRDTGGKLVFGPVFPIGSRREVTPEQVGVLYLRINDAWGDLANNSGDYRVTLSADSATPR